MPPKRQKTSDPESLFQFEAVPECVIFTDPQHVIQAANRATLEVLGYAREELVGWPLEKIFPQLPRDLAGLVAGRVKELGFQVKARMRSGKRAILDFVASPVSLGGQVAALLYLGRDVRVRSLLDEEIRRARNYFRAIVEHSPYGICVTGLDRRVMMFNRAAEDITGWSSDGIIGRSVAEFYPLEKNAEQVESKPLRAGQRLVRQLQFRRHDGNEVPVKVSYVLIPDPGGNGELIVESYSDLTDRKRVDQLRNEFVFVAAHELRNPVTAIKLLLDIIFEDKRLVLDPILRGYLLKMQEGEERLLRLVDDLLEVSRTEAGRLKIQVAPQNPAEVIANLLAELRPTAVNKNVSLNYRAYPGLPSVMADPGKLKEVLSNLVSNAVKYNVTGGTVTVSHQVKGNFVWTRVADTGIGITKEDVLKLYQKFWRSEDLAVRAQAGTGLGLFIVKELIGRMGGEVAVESQKGRGSVFSFSLPVAG